jgi:hypothetical protein
LWQEKLARLSPPTSFKIGIVWSGTYTVPAILRRSSPLKHFFPLADLPNIQLFSLAGAMGRPVWTLLSYSPDWRWMLDRNDTPWYESVRLFRQKTLGDWKGLLLEVKNALADQLS